MAFEQDSTVSVSMLASDVFSRTTNCNLHSIYRNRGVDVFGKEIKNHEILPLMMDLMANADLALQHRLLKDMNLFLLHKVVQSQWHAMAFCTQAC